MRQCLWYFLLGYFCYLCHSEGSIIVLRVKDKQLELLLRQLGIHEQSEQRPCQVLGLPQVSPGDDPIISIDKLSVFPKATFALCTTKTIFYQLQEYHVIAENDLPEPQYVDTKFSWHSLQDVLFCKLIPALTSLELERVPYIVDNWVETLNVFGYSDIKIIDSPRTSTVVRYGPLGEVNMLLYSPNPHMVQFGLLPTPNPRSLVSVPLKENLVKLIIRSGVKKSFLVYRSHESVDGSLEFPYQHQEGKDYFCWSNLDLSAIDGNDWIDNDMLCITAPLQSNKLHAEFALDSKPEINQLGCPLLRAIWKSTYDKIQIMEELKREIKLEVCGGTLKISYSPDFYFERPHLHTVVDSVQKDALEAAIKELDADKNARVMVANYAKNNVPDGEVIPVEYFWEGEIYRRTTLPFILHRDFGYRKNTLYPISENPQLPQALYSDNIAILRYGRHSNFQFVNWQLVTYHVQICTITPPNAKDLNQRDAPMFEGEGKLSKAGQEYVGRLIELQFQVAIYRKAEILILGDLDFKMFGFEKSFFVMSAAIQRCIKKYNGALKKVVCANLPQYMGQLPPFMLENNPAQEGCDIQ